MSAPKLTWIASAGRFQRADGRFVPESVVRAELDRSLMASQQRIRMLGDDLRSGRISLEGWRVQFKAEIKNAHLRGAALAKGGWERMGPADFGRVGQIVRGEYAHLEAWVGAIRDGAPLDGRLTTRGNLYAQAGRGTFHKVQEQEMLQRGVQLERSILHPADHCDQCIAEAAAGFRPIGQMVPIGERTCGRSCRCSIQYQREAA